MRSSSCLRFGCRLPVHTATVHTGSPHRANPGANCEFLASRLAAVLSKETETMSSIYNLEPPTKVFTDFPPSWVVTDVVMC